MSDIIEYPLVKMYRGSRNSDFNYKKNRIDRDDKIKVRKKELQKIQKERLERRKVRQPYIDIDDVKGTWKKSKLSKKLFLIIMISAVIITGVMIWYLIRKNKQNKK